MIFNTLLSKFKYVAVLSSMSMLVACGSSSNDSEFSNVDDSVSATYAVTFDATWGADTHPTNIPAGTFPETGSAPHFSPMVLATHNSQVILWENGQIASEGTKIIAESGNPSTFIAEAEAAITAGTAKAVVKGAGGFASPGSQKVTIEASVNFPQVTFLSMIAPSPDWLGGARIDTLLVNGEFVETLTVDVLAYDAGTDSGTRYTSDNTATDPVGVITKLLTDPADTSFANPEKQKIGTLTFVKQ